MEIHYYFNGLNVYLMNGIKTPLVVLTPLVTHMLSCFLVCVTLRSVVGVYLNKNTSPF